MIVLVRNTQEDIPQGCKGEETDYYTTC